MSLASGTDTTAEIVTLYNAVAKLEVMLRPYKNGDATATKPGRFTEAQRQQAGRQGIQCAGMPALGGREKPARLLQGVIGSQPERLVEQQNAIDLFPDPFALHGWLILPASGRSGHWPD